MVLILFFNELDTRQGTLLHGPNHRTKEAMASKRFSSNGGTILRKGYMSKDLMEKPGSNAPSTWCTTSPTRSSRDVGMEQVAM